MVLNTGDTTMGAMDWVTFCILAPPVGYGLSVRCARHSRFRAWPDSNEVGFLQLHQYMTTEQIERLLNLRGAVLKVTIDEGEFSGTGP